jgi:hypothetical protein
MFTAHEPLTDAIAPPVIGTVLPVAVKPLTSTNCIAGDDVAAVELFPVIVTFCGRNPTSCTAPILRPLPPTVLFVNDWLEMGACSTIEYA